MGTRHLSRVTASQGACSVTGRTIDLVKLNTDAVLEWEKGEIEPVQLPPSPILGLIKILEGGDGETKVAYKFSPWEPFSDDTVTRKKDACPALKYVKTNFYSRKMFFNVEWF